MPKALTWQHAGPQREETIAVPEISIGNYGYALVHDPKRARTVYVRAKDYGGEVEAWSWDGAAWTKDRGKGEIQGEEAHGYYDRVRGGVAMWSVEHDYKVDRAAPNGVLVTDGKIARIKTKGDQPLIEPESDEEFYLSSNIGCAMAFDDARGVAVCLTRRGVWELDGAGVWARRGEPSKVLGDEWHGNQGGTWDPVGKRTVFWVQLRGHGYKHVLVAWDGAALAQIPTKGLPDLRAGSEPAVMFVGHPKHGVVAQLGGKHGMYRLAGAAWTKLPDAKGDAPPRILGRMGNGLPRLAHDAKRDAFLIGPGYLEDDPGGSDAQRVFYELAGGSWRRLGTVQRASPIEDLSNHWHAAVGGTWYAVDCNLRVMAWQGTKWTVIVDEKAGAALVGKDDVGAIAATPEGLVAVSQKGAVWRLDGKKWQALAKATSTFKTRREFLLAHDGARLVAWGGETNNRKSNDTLTFDGKKWALVKKVSPAPKYRTKEVEFIDFTIVFDTALGRLVRFGYQQAHVLDGDEWKIATPPGYGVLGGRAWQHVPAHDPVTRQTLVIDFEGEKIVRFDLAKCEVVASIKYPADLKKIAAREHESVHHWFHEDAVFAPASRSLESQHKANALARYSLALGTVFDAIAKRPRTPFAVAEKRRA